MNLFAIIILTALILGVVLELAGNLLNLKALKLKPPPTLEGIYNAKDYQKSQQYIRVKTPFSLLISGFRLFLIITFWFSGGFDWLDQVIGSWNFNPIANGVLYIGILLFSYYLLTLPFGIYSTFVIEERFGFNRTTPKTFSLDQIRGLFLALVLGLPLLSGILALFQYAGSYAWLYCWAAVILFFLVMQYLAPTLIMPLFNKFTPMEAGELKEAILRYASSVNFSIDNVFVMDGSKRSSKSNAFFTGFGQNKRIALFDTLIARHTIPEIIAILAHEIGHYKKKHVLKGIVISILHTGLVFFLLSILLSSPGLYQAFYVTNEPVYAGLIFFGLLYTPIEIIVSILILLFSRKSEYQADRFAAETTDDPDSLIMALRKLSATNLSNLTPHPLYVFLNYSHPPLLQRIRKIQDIK
jgi:STE24 endopeptidase